MNEACEGSRRHRTIGMVTWGRLRFIYGRVRMGGKVHMYLHAVIRWEQPPYPHVTFVTRCGGRQFSHVFPESRDEFAVEEVCQRCFPDQAPSILMIRTMERREQIVETVESMAGTWTYRDVWDRTYATYSLVTQVVLEMRQHGLVRVISPPGKQPIKMQTCS